MRSRHPVIRLDLAGLLFSLLWLGPMSAAGQHPAIGAPPPRPLTVRLALADAGAIARVEAVDAGRVRLVDARSLWGDVAPDLQIKRAPSSPPDVAPGEWLMLLLRGARSPYLLVDRAGEIPRVESSSDADDWARTLRSLRQHQRDAADVSTVLARALESQAASLRRDAARGLADAQLDVSGLAPATFERLADLATASPDAGLRRAAAEAAVRHAAGRRRLVARLPGDDPLVLEIALGAVLAHAEADATSPRTCDEALLRGLRHPRPELRAAALRAGAPLAGRREVRREIVRMAAEDEVSSLRALARRVMHASATAPSRIDGTDGPDASAGGGAVEP